MTFNLSKRDQLLNTHRSPSTDNRDSLHTFWDGPRVECVRVTDGAGALGGQVVHDETGAKQASWVEGDLVQALAYT